MGRSVAGEVGGIAVTMKRWLTRIPISLWLVIPMAIGIALSFAASPILYPQDPTTGFSFAVLVLTCGGIAQAVLSIVAKNWLVFLRDAGLAHAALFVILFLVGIKFFSDTGLALTALIMPIIFPGLALIAASLVRFLGGSLYRMVHRGH